MHKDDNRTKPNIILILTDQCRRDGLEYMPNVRKLASEGTSFTNAYTPSPLCQPARASILTGYLPHQTGICGNAADPISEEMKMETFPNILRKNGYNTAMVGKHHFIDNYAKCRDITQDNELIGTFGFDHVVQVLDDGENSHNDDAYTAYLKENNLLDKFRGVDLNPHHGDNFFNHVFEEEYTAEYFIYKSGIKFVKEHKTEEPIYLQWSFIGPHPPLWHFGDLTHDPANMSAPIGVEDKEEYRIRRAHYAQKCSIIDSYVGKMVELLKQKNMYENTVFIFTSDHGDSLGDHGIWDKRSFYESSAGVPLILAGPSVPKDTMMNGNKQCKALVTLLDLYPTILNLVGAEFSTNTRLGKDLIPMIKDQPGSSHHEVFSELGTSVMIRTAGWKMVYDPQQGGPTYLFNLKTDPNEMENLVGNPLYEGVMYELVSKILNSRIRISQYTHEREQNRIQRIHIV